MKNTESDYQHISINDNIPIPAIKYGMKYKWLEILKEGQSALIHNDNKNQISSALAYYTKKTGFKYTQRKQENGIRIWRIK